MNTQEKRIIDHLLTYGHIEQLTALQKYGISRLASRISDLKKKGYLIRAERVNCLNRFGEPTHYAQYTLEGVAENETA